MALFFGLRPSVLITTTKKHLQYANGYIELGMFGAASDEIESIEGDDRMSLEVMLV